MDTNLIEFGVFVQFVSIIIMIIGASLNSYIFSKESANSILFIIAIVTILVIPLMPILGKMEVDFIVRIFSGIIEFKYYGI